MVVPRCKGICIFYVFMQFFIHYLVLVIVQQDALLGKKIFKAIISPQI